MAGVTMGVGRRTGRWVVAASVAMAVTVAVVGTGHSARAASLAIAVSGNELVNGSGTPVVLRGVDVPSTEYACQQGWGYASPPLSAATAAAIAAWHANAVRVPFNEDCWLGINGQPSYGTAAGYRRAIAGWVANLNAAGLYAVLDLHWSAPGTNVADGQRPMPDDHSTAFWSSVASTFAAQPAVLFDAFNEPYSPAANGNSTLSVSWSCWLNGGCAVPVANQDGPIDDDDTYDAVGMQAIVDTIRATGATQPVMVGGLSYANDLSGWLAHEPTDPEHQLVASFHNYFGEACDSSACWSSVIAPVAARVPVVTGEFDQGYDCAHPPSSPAALATFDTTYMGWADQHGVGYLAWGWWVLGNAATNCSALADPGDRYALVSSYAGSPVAPDGTALRAHLAALAASPPLTVSTASLPLGAVGVGYTAGLSARGGNPPYRWSLASGGLPRGLHLRPRGTIVGRPRAAGTVMFTVRVTDHRSKAKPHTKSSATRTLSLTVG